MNVNWPWRFLESAKRNVSAKQGHMTFAQGSIGRSISRTRIFLRKQLWIWPIVAMILLAIVGYAINTAIKSTIENNLRSQLDTLLRIETSMIEKWLAIQEANATALANRQTVRKIASDLSQVFKDAKLDESGSKTVEQLRREFEQELSSGQSMQGFVGFVLTDKTHRVIASSNPELLDKTIPQYDPFLSVAVEGETITSTPFASVVMMKNEAGVMQTGVPTMFACAPIRDDDLRVIGVLSCRIRPEREFTQILQLGRLGDSGETLAFNKDGLLVSNSRFDEEMILIGLIPDVENARSILTVSLRDPGGDLEKGFRPGVRRSELPLTVPVASATKGGSGIDIVGNRDYRGVDVVSAWTWLPKYKMGILTAIDRTEAFKPLNILRWAFFTVFGLLILSSIAIFVFTISLARMELEARKATIEAKKLGQYHLEEKIGAGAMGEVYKGHHAMLRRPTAIKLLNADNVNESSIARFEREVQITCKLNHPNTIAVYDFGRTPEGVFYYAMEFLDGIDLQALVQTYGPQPEGRVIHVLTQICGSLYEAHQLGLVHRDVKPANIMLNRRGGESDVVKVLDFGLVKAIESPRATQSQGIIGTPLYMSPEAIQTPDAVDARSDIYAVGAVGYFLLTGQPVFAAKSLVELCQQQLTAVPVPPSQRVVGGCSVEIESAILACLEKNPSNRPQTARELLRMLCHSPHAKNWSNEEAEIWWGRHSRGVGRPDQSSTAESDPKNNAIAAGSSRSESKPSSPTGAEKTDANLDRTLLHE